jgi:hypothetical protein
MGEGVSPLSLELGQAQLQRIPETTMYTVALSDTEFTG